MSSNINSTLENVGHRSKVIHKPTQLNFDEFIPWVCLQWQVPNNIVIKRISAALPHSRKNSFKSQNNLSNSTYSTSVPISLQFPVFVKTSIDINVTTYYDAAEQLTQVAITNCPILIPKKLIQAINICIPFHASLTKFKITNGGMNFTIVKEIQKLLPLSNITELCLDSNNAAEVDYSVVIDELSQLKCLSLNKCNINDEVCRQISSKIKFGRPASKFLLALSLSINDITDEGAISLADCLRKNRKLRHLNLCGNKISDIGAEAIFDNLKEFPLTYNEILEHKRRKLEYLKKKKETYKQCLKDVAAKLIESEESVQDKETVSIISKRKKSLQRKNKRKQTITNDNISEADEQRITEKLVEARMREIIGDFKDIFDNQNTKIRHGYKYGIGNLAICSINLAYNNLGHLSIKKLSEVLKYQSQFLRSQEYPGLLRVVIDGNNIPKASKELYNIDFYLKMAITEMVPIDNINNKVKNLSLRSRSRSRNLRNRSLNMFK